METPKISVVVTGRDRTLMTIECVKQIRQHLRYRDYSIIVGSDRSENGHVQAVRSYLKTINVAFDVLECQTLGGMMNDCCTKAFAQADYVLCVENDMILHRDLMLDRYIDLLEHTQAGNVQFRYFAPDTHKSGVGFFEYRGHNFIYTVPSDAIDTHPVSFGQNFFSKRFYEQIGGFFAGEQDTDKVERDFVNKYAAQLGGSSPLLNVIDCEELHKVMNDDRGYFYHIGINCQHREGVRWNAGMIPDQYHYLSNSELDRAFRRIFA